jgi:tetratricopeptide (TPR) repeat protein
VPPPPSTVPPSSLPAAVVAAEQRAREFLAAQKWRKARDELKPLAKTDRDRFLPLLIQANLGLAREMMSKGQVTEAQQVLNYLATIAPGDQLRAVELELVARSSSEAIPLGKLAVALADKVHPLAEAERIRLADQLVLSFQPLPAGEAATAALAAELKSVHDALLAVSQARWEAVAEGLRPVARRSPFSHWVLLIKGLAAYFVRDLGKAERFFASLPPDSVPERASRAFLLLAGRLPETSAGQPPPVAVLEGACALCGLPGLGKTLLRADSLWRSNAHAESYQALRESTRAFPGHGRDLLGVLSQFYFHAPFRMAERERDGWLRYLDGLLARGGCRNATEEMLIRRMFALLDCAIMPAATLRQDWELFLRHHEILRGKNDRLASLAYGWLGEQLSMRRVQHALYSNDRVQLRDPKGALEVLRRSIQLDPDNLKAHLQLCAVYDALKQTSERNRLLDEMTKRFPDDKSVLLHAARGCLKRKAFVKGLQYLDRAQQLDPLDPELPPLRLSAQRQQAQQHFRERRPEKARQILAQTEALLVDKPEDFERGRWAARARLGVVERLWGEPARAEAALAEARALAPSAELVLLFCQLETRACRNQRFAPTDFLPELKKVMRGVSRLSVVLPLLRLLFFWREAHDDLYTVEEEKSVQQALDSAMHHPFTEAEAMAVIETVQGDFGFDDAVWRLTDKVLARDAQHPQFRLVRFARSRGFRPVEESRSELNEILEEAQRRKDDVSVRKVRQELHSLDHPLPPPLPLPLPYEPDGPDGPAWGDNFDGDDHEEDDRTDILPNIPPGELAGLDELMDVLRTAPKQAIAEMRATRPKDMPAEIFDMLVKMAKTGKPPSDMPLIFPPVVPPTAKPAPPPPPVKPPPQPPDPNQRELF